MPTPEPDKRMRRAISLRCAAALAIAAAGSGVPGASTAQTIQGLQQQSLAATCAACHGPQGHAAAGSAIPGLAGMRKEHLAAQLLAFRDGSRPATVMHQIAKGYSPAQIDALAAYFAAQK